MPLSPTEEISLLARVAFQSFPGVDFLFENQWFVSGSRRLPYWLSHRAIRSFIWLETWLRYPLATLNMMDRVKESLSVVDPGGRKFGLSERVCRAYLDNLLYNDVPDTFALFTQMERRRFRHEALRYENDEAFMREAASGPGAIVAGFRIGLPAALPFALATLRRDVLMMVGHPSVADLGERAGSTLLPRLSRRVRFAYARDPRVLTRCTSVLDGGGIVATLAEMSGLEYEKTTKVRFLDWEIDVPYGLSYLSAVTRRSIVPAALTRADGPQFTLRFGEPIRPPARDKESVQAGAQALYLALEQFVRRFPEQWVGWTQLHSHMGIDTGQGASPVSPVVA